MQNSPKTYNTADVRSVPDSSPSAATPPPLALVLPELVGGADRTNSTFTTFVLDKKWRAKL